METKTVIFDLGNVLISFDPQKRLKQIAELVKLRIEKVEDILISSGLALQYEKGVISSKDLHLILCEKLKQQIDFDALIEANCNIFTPRPYMIEVVKKLKQKGLRLIILSNTNEAHFDYISKKYDFLSLFDALVLSYEVKSVKPEKEIYEQALKMARTSPQECFYIDDIPEYIAVAEKMEIRSHVYTSYPAFIEALKAHGILHLRLSS